jgi:preprotein translocase subunit SecB
MAAPNMGALELTEHGVQLNYVAVKEMHFESTRLPSAIPVAEYGETSISTGRSDYNEEAKTIQVKLLFELVGAKEMQMRVELVAQFKVDESVFPKDKIHAWAERASHYILFPFLREQVYALSMRVGLQPVMVPTFLLPTFKIESPTEHGALEMAHG